MALGAVATADLSAYCTRFTITGASSASALRIDAYPRQGSAYVVRTMFTPQPDGSIAAMDGDVPLDVETSYIVTDTGNGSQTIVAVLTVTAPGPVFADATDPTRSVLCTVVSQLPNEWQPRTVWWDVLGARAPFVSIAPLRFRNGSLVLHLPDAAARDQVLAILAPGVPFVLRTTCRDAVDDVIGVLDGPMREDLVLDSDPGGARLLTLPYQAVARELGQYRGDAGRTYGVMLSQSATYQVVANNYQTYADVLSGTPR